MSADFYSAQPRVSVFGVSLGIYGKLVKRGSISLDVKKISARKL